MLTFNRYIILKLHYWKIKKKSMCYARESSTESIRANRECTCTASVEAQKFKTCTECVVWSTQNVILTRKTM